MAGGTGPGVFPAQVGTKRDFGVALTAVRESAGLSVRELARRAEVPQGTLSGWMSGRHLPYPAQKDMFERVLATCGVGAREVVDTWVACWLRLREPLGKRAAEAAPYRGLEPFEPEHTNLFFGRLALTELLVRDVLAAEALTAVVGPSGSGKSSVLKAGLVARLCGVSSTPSWQSLLMTPGSDPLGTLAEELALLTDGSSPALESGLRNDPTACAESLRAELARPLLVVVDQLEEIFTSAQAVDRGVFVRALHALAIADTDLGAAAVAIRVVVGLRADFYPEALGMPDLAEALQHRQIVVGSMNEGELREVIVEPARSAGVGMETALVSVLLRELAPAGVGRDAEHGAGSLPLLSHALLATCERGRNRVMTVTDYEATGGIHGAIAHTADAIYVSLTDDQQDLVRRLFLRLIHVGDDGPDTRRRVRIDELSGDNEAVLEQIREVLGRYVEQRLITADADGVQVSHEALLHAWPRLRRWVNADRAGHRLHRQLTEATRAWELAAGDDSALYRGVRLVAATEWAQEHASDLNSLERRFIEASIEASRMEHARDRRRVRRLRWLAASLAVLLVASSVTAVYAFQQRTNAERERNQAISRQIAGTANRLRESDPALAAQLAVAAYRVAPTVEARSSVITSSAVPAVTRMMRQGGALQAVAVNLTGTVLAAAGAADHDTTIELWSLEHPGRPVRLGEPLRGHSAAIYAVAFSPDGRTLATGSKDTTVRLWDLTDPARAVPLGEPLRGPDKALLAVEFSPDGSLLATGGRDQKVRLYDVRDRSRPVLVGPELTGAGGAVQSVTFQPHGMLLAVADADNAVQVWDLRDATRPAAVGSGLPVPSRVNTVSFSPDGKTLTAGSNDGTLRLWVVASDGPPVPAGELSGATGWINAIAYSSDGTRLAAGNADGVVQVWDTTTRKVAFTLPHPEPVNAVAFRDQDHALLTNSADGIARRWEVPGPTLATSGRSITTLAFHHDRQLMIDAGVDLQIWDLKDRDRPNPLGSRLTAPPGVARMGGTVALSTEGTLLAAGTREKNLILLWDISNDDEPQLLATIPGHAALIESVTFSPDGRILASASDDRTIRLWDTTDPRAPLALTTISPETGYVYQAVFSPDGNLLVAATQDGIAHIWDLRDPRNPVRLGEPLTVSVDYNHSVAVSSDGRILAAGSADGSVRLWDISDPAHPGPLGDPIAGPDGYLLSLTFAPDDRTLAAGSGTGQTWLWDISDPARPITKAILHTPKQTTWDVLFRPDGTTLATADGDIHLWDTDADRASARICAHAGDILTQTEWAKHVPGADFQSACP